LKDGAEALATSDLGVLLTQLTPDDLSRIADGRATLSGAGSDAQSYDGSIASIWKPNETDTQIRNLGTTELELKRIRLLVHRVRRTASIRAADSGFANATDAELGELEQLVYAAWEAIANVRGLYSDFQEALAERDAEIADVVNILSLAASEQVTILGSSGGTFVSRAAWYFSADLGLAYVGRFDEFLAYFGLNIYFRPVNKQVPLARKGGFLRRFAAMVGVTLQSVEKEGQRKGIFGNKGLVYGVGYRLSDYVRLTVGGVLFYEIDSNPTISEEKVSTVGFIAVSFDWDIKGTLGDFGTAITGK
jgi:hypothetical protein